ncbi:hypothetical protein [Bacteroides pyogenes]|uniref:hypothetical protein n=1 Tax=Bacteroides pyogenes TaxID=310300 RepID=UPI001BABDE9F|nr:hypothetical protein [Bacteroides pyogenes]MBR8705637.1 hypothetical protein [Bacteroides pyogenes]
MNTFQSTILISGIVFLIFIYFQIKYFLEVRHYRNLFSNFFSKKEEYSTYETEINGEAITQLKQVGADDSDLNTLIAEINHYVAKTKGTTDFAVIQNKVERKLNMRYDQSVAKLAFPTYLGLMGTFAGVFLGITMFIGGFDGTGDITDESIKNLLFGMLVSMSTSLIGLFLTTINNALAGESRKNIEEDKNDFYDFVQTELMPSLDVSMVLAITRLHETVDRFEPAFDRVISRFQTTFDNCTRAFGNSFETNVRAVAEAVDTMGRNMNKINENISLQQQLLSTLRSQELIKGMDKYIEAADHFVSITKSLDKFEEARRMMLAAAQEAINLQNSYSDALKIPREVAVRCNQILDRIKTFEDNVNRVGGSLENRQILGNDVIETIREQINQIRKKDKVAMKYFETADGNLDNLFEEQTKLIDQLNKRYKDSIVDHIEGFGQMLKDQKEELKKRHQEFLEEMRSVVNVEEIHKDFSNLKKLNEIFEQLKRLTADPVKADELHKKLQKIQEEIAKIDVSKAPASGLGSIFSRRSSNSAEVSELRTENIRLQGDIERLTREVNRLVTEKQSAPTHTPASNLNAPVTPELPKQETKEKPIEEPNKGGGWWPFGKRN